MTEVEKIGNNRQLMGALSLGYSLIALIFAYFYFFPTLITPLFSDTLIVSGILLLLSCLIYASVKANSSREVVLVLLGVILVSILARSIPHLRLAYPPFGDPYFYAISALNIIDYGTLQPMLAGWYSGIIVHLHWPIMHLVAAIAVKLSGIDSMWFFRFQEPLLSGLFVLAVFALAKEATKNNTIALLSALLAALSDVVIFYQAEYHPQGFALIFFVLFLYLYLKSRTTGRLRYHILALVCLVVFLASHHFSSIFVGLLAIGFIVFNHLIAILPQRLGQITQAAREIRADYNLWLIVAVAGLAYHFWIYEGVVRGFLERYAATTLEPSAALLTTGASVPMLTTLLNSAKWGILLLATFSIIRVIRPPRPHQFRLLVMLGCILFAGFVGTFIVWGPVDRIIAFYVPLVSVFAAMTVHRLLTLNRFSLRRAQVIKVTTILIVSLLLMAGFFNGINIPAFYFQSSQPSSSYRYSNQVPKMEVYKLAGEWTGMYIPGIFYVGSDPEIVAFLLFVDKRSLSHIISPPRYPTTWVDYVMFASSVPRRTAEPKKTEYDRDLNMIYDNGEIKIYKVP